MPPETRPVIPLLNPMLASVRSHRPLARIGLTLLVALQLAVVPGVATSTEAANTAAGSSVTAGGNLTLVAHTDKGDGNITIKGSDLKAGQNATLIADQDINLLASESRSEQHSKNKSSSSSIGVSVSTTGGISATPGGSSAGIAQVEDQASSMTLAAITGEAGNKDARTGDAETGLQKIFDADKVQKQLDAQIAITQKFGELAPKAAADYAKTQGDNLKAQANALKDSDPTKSAELYAEAKKWEEGGAYRIALHTALGAAVGNLEGALGAGVVAGAAPYLNDLQGQLADSLKEAGLNDKLADAAGQLVSQGLATGLGTAVGGSAGGSMGFNVDSNNRQLHDTEKQRIKQLAKQSGISEERLQAAACAKVQCWAEYSSEMPEFMVNLEKARQGLADQEALAILNAESKQNSSFLYYSDSDNWNDTKKQLSNNLLSSGKGFLKGALSTGKSANEILVSLYGATYTPTDFPVGSGVTSSYEDSKDVTTPSNWREQDAMLAGEITSGIMLMYLTAKTPEIVESLEGLLASKGIRSPIKPTTPENPRIPTDGEMNTNPGTGSPLNNQGGNPQGLTGKDFEIYLHEELGGKSSFSVKGREFDGAYGLNDSIWYEAKSGQYWQDYAQINTKGFEKFKSDIGAHAQIAKNNGASFEVHSNTPIPQHVKEWLDSKGIPFKEY